MTSDDIDDLDDLKEVLNSVTESSLSEELTTDESLEIRLGIGEYEVVTPPEELSCHGLGSCIAIFLYDSASNTGAGIHTLLPTVDNQYEHPESGNKKKTRFTDVGINRLYEEITNRQDVEAENIIGKMVGGSEMLQLGKSESDVGEKNVSVARETLEQLQIEIVAEDTGGKFGRIVNFDPATGTVEVRNAEGKEIEL